MTTKAELRKDYKANMPQWLKQHPDTADRIAFHIIKLGWAERQTVAAYWALATEIPTLPLLRILLGQGHQLALPRVEDSGMGFRAWQYNEDDAQDFGLTHDARNIWAPPETAPVVLPDVVIAPVTAFDASGMRLGKGRGDYDGAITALRIKKPTALYVGIALDEQQTQEMIPAEPHDVRLNLVITPKGVITPRL